MRLLHSNHWCPFGDIGFIQRWELGLSAFPAGLRSNEKIPLYPWRDAIIKSIAKHHGLHMVLFISKRTPCHKIARKTADNVIKLFSNLNNVIISSIQQHLKMDKISIFKIPPQVSRILLGFVTN